MKSLKIMSLGLVVVLAGCASTQGTVTPYEGGLYQSVIAAKTKTAALKIAANDAKITCDNLDQRYVVKSQDVVEFEPKELNTGIGAVDTLGKIAVFAGEVDDGSGYEVTTVFACVS